MSQTRQSTTLPIINLALVPSIARQITLWIAVALLAVFTAPATPSNGAVWLLVFAALLGALSQIALALANDIETPLNSLICIGVTFASGIVALILTVIVRPLSILILMPLLIAVAWAASQRPFVAAGITVTFVPWWIWVALGAWRWQLIVLMLLIAFAVVAISHLVDALVWPDDTDRLMSPRAHRFAAWILIALAGISVILFGLLGGCSKPWLALAGIVLALSIPLEAGLGSDNVGSARRSIRIVGGAFLIAGACWLISIS